MCKVFEVIGRAVVGGLIGFAVGKLIEQNYNIDRELSYLNAIKENALKK